MLTPIQQDFRHAMSKLAAGVNIITTKGDAGQCGITATAVCSLTDSPPTVIVCINKNSATNPIFQQNRRICINVLSSEQRELAEHFAGFKGSTMEERFQWQCWDENELFLCLKDSLANLSGNVVDVQDIGSHSMFLVELDKIKVNPQDKALVYFSRNFHTVG
ncbi:4-hydroxyphenylacetate 3-monooxygenase, reductase component [Lonepinella koalarum]|uniref:4-hydroxyphenylacetate 3-monooxygenase reductase component n=1 Tax=Lonepinella koalarum TaxID=53417 RepID=A0A4R1KR89_9PAST|nr:4-hydroxyphenylacetate 3-monooxygenase, reductase component [Lonepinella koalarum]MDH2926382.1 4-hydroxyphenylacetate 3-monooxygenase [Lonepinella koalarum]TCK67000.1 4-hydroxyphenylacetate 3-monooxygenase reductase component [Lonepinella koalarum]TFJ89129.1 4-hydroxyphenylacetate 3-monooxygenase, reductase component [Lonepinella koalarum]TYG34401.1 4-hydroxyphenylacetate 3-monooxygenase, reductase component [Lonepinella koalarum]